LLFLNPLGSPAFADTVPVLPGVEVEDVLEVVSPLPSDYRSY
jgi:hypothetical protein